MPPQPLKDLRDYVERTQATLPDPAERIRALAVVERELEDLIGVTRTYANDARLQQQGAPAGNGTQDDAEPT